MPLLPNVRPRVSAAAWHVRTSGMRAEGAAHSLVLNGAKMQYAAHVNTAPSPCQSTRPLSPWLHGLGVVCMGTRHVWFVQRWHTQETHGQNRRSEHTQMRSHARTANTRAYVQTHTLHTQLRRGTDGPYPTHRRSALQSAIGLAMQSLAGQSAMQSSGGQSAMRSSATPLSAQRSAGSCRLDSSARQSELRKRRQCRTAGESAHLCLTVSLTH